MTVGALRGITVDVSDLDRGAAFWGGILGLAIRHRRGTYLWFDEIAPGVQLILQRVPEAKVAKNRVHLDVVSDDPEALISSVEALGGKRISQVEEDDYSLTVLADADGNELCVLNELSAGLATATEMP
jgi:hypothetical protein